MEVFMPKIKRRPNGSGTAIKRGRSWQARIVTGWHTVNGKKLPIWETKDGFDTRSDAWAYCDMLIASIVKQPSETLLGVYEAWESSYAPRVSQSTMGCYQAAMIHLAHLHTKPIRSVSIDDWQAAVDNCDRGKRTRENIKALAGLLYKYAVPRRLADSNLAAYIHTGENDKSTRPAFTSAQVEIISKSKAKYADYILSLIYTGMRPSEMFDLKPSSYNNGVLTGGAKTEAGKNRIIPVSPKIKPIIERNIKNKDWLFPRSDGSKMSERFFRDECFYPALAEMGINGYGLSPYSCRHTFANLLKNVKGSDTDKAALMGHASPTMTKYYQSPDLESLTAITNAI